MPANTKEIGLEDLIESYLLTHGWLKPADAGYSKEYAIDQEMLKAFLSGTQGEIVTRSKIFTDELERQRFLTRLKNEISTRVVVDVLRHELAHKSYNFTFAPDGILVTLTAGFMAGVAATIAIAKLFKSLLSKE